MPDITMCANDDCPLKARCYRYQAKPNPGWQSFAIFKPETDGSCLEFMKIWKREGE